MRKIITLLLLTITAFTHSSFAQPGTVCNPEFNFTVAGNTVQFVPAIINTSALLQHYWMFDDGHNSNLNSPLHIYAATGIYNVKHIVKYHSPNDSNVIACTDSAVRQVIITGPAPCNLHANFSFERDSVQTNKVYFSNHSTGTTPNTIIKWTFGDGTFSYDNNPTHIYNVSGAYTACLLVRRDSLCADDTCKIVQVQVPANACNLVAYFGSHIDSLNFLTVHFTNYSTPLVTTDSIRWTFGDGTSSADINPSHSFTAPGTYNVCLRVKKVTQPGAATCVREFCKTIIVQQQCNLVANFSFHRDTTSGIVANTLRFENTSTPLTGIDSSLWDFGDGSPVVINPNNSLPHVYTAPGNYIVCLRVKKIQTNSTAVLCERQICHTIVVTAPPVICNLEVNFNWHADSANRRKINFNNLSTPHTSNAISLWTFGDGNSSNGWNADHIYAQPGQYRVCLKISLNNTCIKDTCQLIVVRDSTVIPPCNLVVYFSALQDSVVETKTHFTNLSTSLATTDSIRWTYGDGTSSNDISPSHTYAAVGTYTVCLWVKKNNTQPGAVPCVGEFCRTIIVPAPSTACNISVHFNWHTDSANRRKINFNNQSTTPTSNIISIWNFGDGNSSNGWNADHIYTQPGRYTVCLTIIKENVCTRVWCDSVLVQGSTVPPVNCDSIRLNYVYRRDAYMPNKLFFFATSNFPVAQQIWTFTKLPNGTTVTVNQNDPVHVFGDTGSYRVCLKGYFRGGCVKEYCDVVRIFNTATASQCFLHAYPNPAHNQVSVNMQLQQPELITASVYNLQNMLVLRRTQQGFTGNNLVTLNIENLMPGYYIIRLVYGNKVCYTRFRKI